MCILILGCKRLRVTYVRAASNSMQETSNKPFKFDVCVDIPSDSRITLFFSRQIFRTSTTKSLSCRHLKQTAGTKEPAIRNIHRILRKLFFTEYRFKKVFPFYLYQCTGPLGYCTATVGNIYIKWTKIQHKGTRWFAGLQKELLHRKKW